MCAILPINRQTEAGLHQPFVGDIVHAHRQQIALVEPVGGLALTVAEFDLHNLSLMRPPTPGVCRSFFCHRVVLGRLFGTAPGVIELIGVGQIVVHDLGGRASGTHIPVLQPDRMVAQPPDIFQIV